MPIELSGEELWLAADAVRRRVEADPDALQSVRAVLQPVEDEIWFEADEVLEHPDRWASVAGSWGARTLHALDILYPLNGSTATVRCENAVHSYSPRGMTMTYTLTTDDITVGDAVTAQLEKMWGWYLAGGIISVIFGFLVISWRHATVYAAIYFASGFFIVGGLFEIFGSFRMARQRWMHLVFGVLWVGAGIVGFVWPHITIFVIAVLIGWSFLVLGIFDIVSSIQYHHLPYWWLYLIRGVIALGLGFLCIRHPGGTLATVIVMVGILAILFGVVEIIGALSARHATRYWDRYKKQLS